MTILSSKPESSQEIEADLRNDVGSGIGLNRLDIVPAVLLVAFCVFIFRGVIFDGHLLFGSDFVAFYQGMKQFLFDEIHNHHSIPFWNPYIFSGMPFWAHVESTIFYPLGILFWIIAPAEAFGYTMFIHMSLAALFMYLLLRSLSTGYGGSFVAAAVFTCNGFIMATLYDGQMFRVQAYIWLPLVIYLLNRALKPENSYLSAVIAAPGDPEFARTNVLRTKILSHRATIPRLPATMMAMAVGFADSLGVSLRGTRAVGIAAEGSTLCRASGSGPSRSIGRRAITTAATCGRRPSGTSWDRREERSSTTSPATTRLSSSTGSGARAGSAWCHATDSSTSLRTRVHATWKRS